MGWQQRVLPMDSARADVRAQMFRQLDEIRQTLLAQDDAHDEALLHSALLAVSAFQAELTQPLIRKDVLQQLLKTIRLVSAVSPLVAEVRQKVARVY